VTGPKLSLVLSAKAARQIEDADAWWRTNRQGSPQALPEELERVFDLITLQSGVGTPVRRQPGVRRVLLARVGYFLYYRVTPSSQLVEVLAFWHARRGSGPRL
jgi:plasmid stabilization system protein ParE